MDNVYDFAHEVKFFEKIAQIDLCFVICLYTCTILMAILSRSYEQTRIINISFVAILSALCLFEKLVVAFFLILA
jgi:hypothetical protein